MKRCKKCYKDFSDSQVFCSDCGQALVGQMPESQLVKSLDVNDKKVKSYKAIIIGETIIIVLATIMFFVGWFNGNINW